MNNILNHLGNISVEVFLRDYWQKKPLLIRDAFPGFTSPLDPDEIAGLALEDEIESRIVLEQFQGAPWQLRCGPFSEDAFEHLPANNWTLLVQALDHYIPEVSDLLNSFRFVPSWRLDDVMVSYAVDGGSVGPHYDHYDVFLLQGLGQRHWQLGQQCDDNSAILSGTPLNILKHFEVFDEWTLNPGDMLYLPPRFAHWGRAVGECITYSVGFRAPSVTQLIEEHGQDVSAKISEFSRYSDDDLSLRANHAEICPEDIARVQRLLDQSLSTPGKQEQIAHWFGRYMTEPKYKHEDQQPCEHEDLVVGLELQRNPVARLAYYTLDTDSALLFVNGQDFKVALNFAQKFCLSTDWQVSADDDFAVLLHCLENDVYWTTEQ